MRPQKRVSGEQEWELEGIIRGVSMQAFCQEKNSGFNPIYYRSQGRIFKRQTTDLAITESNQRARGKLEDR